MNATLNAQLSTLNVEVKSGSETTGFAFTACCPLRAAGSFSWSFYVDHSTSEISKAAWARQTAAAGGGGFDEGDL
jgi:hypothetical protein